MKKRGGKAGGLINKKPLELDKKARKKPICRG